MNFSETSMHFNAYHSGYGISQWEMTLQCNVISHWLSPYPVWTLFQNGVCETWVTLFGFKCINIAQTKSHKFIPAWGQFIIHKATMVCFYIRGKPVYILTPVYNLAGKWESIWQKNILTRYFPCIYDMVNESNNLRLLPCMLSRLVAEFSTALLRSVKSHMMAHRTYAVLCHAINYASMENIVVNSYNTNCS